jgi:aarF domain-containing kinase
MSSRLGISARRTGAAIVLLAAGKVGYALRPLVLMDGGDTDVTTTTTTSTTAADPTPASSAAAVGRRLRAFDDELLEPLTPPTPLLGRPALFRLWLLSRASDRLVRDVFIAGRIITDYVGVARGWWDGAAPAGGEGNWDGVHQRSASLLLALCRANRGIYIKLAQHLAQLEYMLPRPYTETLGVMTHAAPVDTFAQVQSVLAAEFGGRGAEDLFVSLDPTPIASASLAQVHVAYLRRPPGVGAGTGKKENGEEEGDGLQKVAVKVQHAGLLETSHADIVTVAYLVRAVRLLFPSFDYVWLADEVERNVPRELDFLNEAANAERARRNFAHRDDVRVPDVFPALTTSRVLTMSFEEGCYPDDAKALRRMGLAPAEVARLISSAFADQIFTHGFLHADPHKANLLVRPRPSTAAGADAGSRSSSWGSWGWGWRWPFSPSPSPSPRPLLVLLDHGLYRELPRPLLLDYARLWLGIIKGDEPSVATSSERLGIKGGELYKLFASMLTTRTWDDMTAATAANDLDGLRAKGTRDDKDETAKNVREYAAAIQHILATVPRDLLLVLKTNDALRAVDASLGAPTNNLLAVARAAQAAVTADALRASPGLRTRLACARDTFALEVRLRAFETGVGMRGWGWGWGWGWAKGKGKEVGGGAAKGGAPVRPKLELR